MEHSMSRMSNILLNRSKYMTSLSLQTCRQMLHKTLNAQNQNQNISRNRNYATAAAAQGRKPDPVTHHNDDIFKIVRSSKTAGLNLKPNDHQVPFQETIGSPPGTQLSNGTNQTVGQEMQSMASQVNCGDLSCQKDQISPQGYIEPSMLKQIYYFDTLEFTKKLEARGFSREQAEGCAQCLLEVVNTTIDYHAKHMVTKPQQEIIVQKLQSEITSVKKDMVILQKSEFSSLRSETEKISSDMARTQGHFQDEVVKLKGQFTLDVNLERGRSVEAHAENEKSLQILHNRIDTEIANLKTTFEVYRNDMFKFAAGTVLTCATLLLGVFRLWS